MRRRFAWCIVLAGCAAPPRAAEEPAPMPELRVQQRVGAEEPTPAEPEVIPVTDGRVTLTATDADVRVILPLLAEAAGISMVLEPDVRGTVSVHFERVPALEALRETLSLAGLAVLAELRPPGGGTVFYTVPVSIDALTAEEIRARFGVSADMARFIVQARPPGP